MEVQIKILFYVFKYIKITYNIHKTELVLIKPQCFWNIELWSKYEPNKPCCKYEFTILSYGDIHVIIVKCSACLYHFMFYFADDILSLIRNDIICFRNINQKVPSIVHSQIDISPVQ